MADKPEGTAQPGQAVSTQEQEGEATLGSSFNELVNEAQQMAVPRVGDEESESSGQAWSDAQAPAQTTETTETKSTTKKGS